METMEKETNTPDQRSSRRFSLGTTARRVGIATLSVALITGASAMYLRASDHDDGEVDTKGRNRNLTDLYVFREGDQKSNASTNDLIFVMNTNPRSLARQQYYFSDSARYEFKVTRVNSNNTTPTGKEDVTLRFEFDPANNNGRQNFTLTAIRNGNAIKSQSLNTTPLNTSPVINNVSLGGSKLAVFAGLREDPFFFDVEQFARVRAGALGIGPKVGFRPTGQAVDFARGYNVNAIVVRVPIKFLQGSNSDTTTFDVWETISIQTGNGFKQFERLARPAINEGLIVTNDFLNAFNSIPPSADLSAAAAPVRAEALKTLRALGNSNPTATAGAFLPDVMRIDTTGESGYANALNSKGSPIRGRKLTDDVIDTTLTVVTSGKVTKDNVSYKGPSGNPAQGHDPLVSQFPYLAPAN